MAKKTTTKYEVTRSALAERVLEIHDSLDDLDTYTTSPADVAELIEEARQLLLGVSDDLRARHREIGTSKA